MEIKKVKVFQICLFDFRLGSLIFRRQFKREGLPENMACHIILLLRGKLRHRCAFHPYNPA